MIEDLSEVLGQSEEFVRNRLVLILHWWAEYVLDAAVPLPKVASIENELSVFSPSIDMVFFLNRMEVS